MKRRGIDRYRCVRRRRVPGRVQELADGRAAEGQRPHLLVAAGSGRQNKVSGEWWELEMRTGATNTRQDKNVGRGISAIENKRRHVDSLVVASIGLCIRSNSNIEELCAMLSSHYSVGVTCPRVSC